MPPKVLRGLQEGDSDDEDVSKDDKKKNKDGGGIKGSMQRMTMYLSFTTREMKRRKLSCCLGCCSCWLVVFCMAILLSLLDNVPAIFLRLAEVEKGEIDLQIMSEKRFGYSINYRQMKQELAGIETNQKNRYSYHSPRIIIPSNFMFKLSACKLDEMWKTPNSDGYYDSTWAYKGNKGDESDCMMNIGISLRCVVPLCREASKFTLHVIDTRREQRMGFGKSWPYGPIPKGQIIMDLALARNLKIREGDGVVLSSRVMPYLTEAFSQV